MTDDLEQDLVEAQQALARISGHADLDDLLDAHDAISSAQRALAKARGEQYATPLDLGFQWSSGAPIPHVLSDGSTAIVICYLEEPDPTWDGTTTQVVSPADKSPSTFAVLTFEWCASIRFGSPNDEALDGHPLATRGLGGYGAYEVSNSAWLAELTSINSVHPNHSPDRWRENRHFFLVFHDDMFEALAEEVSIETTRTSLENALVEAAASLLRRS